MPNDNLIFHGLSEWQIHVKNLSQTHLENYAMQARRRFAGADVDEQSLTTVLVTDTDLNDEKKYSKRWNLRNISNHITTTSGNALRALVQQATSPLIDTRDTSVEPLLPPQGYEEDFVEDLVKEDIVVMTARDRTTEFGNAIRSLQSRNISRAVNIKDPRRAKQIQSYSEFMMIAKYIGKNIASTYAKLEKLTLCEYFW